MRNDMHKVVTERPRVFGGCDRKKLFDRANSPREREYIRHIKVDMRPAKESMTIRHRYWWGGKVLRDHIRPLERYLKSQVGRKWNDVWSDICKVLKGNGLQASHIKDHVKSYVSGISHSGQCEYCPPKGSQRTFWQPVYVDENGILRKNNKHK